MSDVTRYLWVGQITTDPQGTLVSFADYAALRAEIDKYKKYPFEPICLLCGRLTPCMTDEEGVANGGPGKPCTFDPTPKQLFDENKRLRAECKRLKGEIEVGLQLTGSFFEALKPLKLAAIHVENPGRHITDLITQLAASKAMIKELQKEVQAMQHTKAWNAWYDGDGKYPLQEG